MPYEYSNIIMNNIPFVFPLSYNKYINVVFIFILNLLSQINCHIFYKIKKESYKQIFLSNNVSDA